MASNFPNCSSHVASGPYVTPEDGVIADRTGLHCESMKASIAETSSLVLGDVASSSSRGTVYEDSLDLWRTG